MAKKIPTNPEAAETATPEASAPETQAVASAPETQAETPPEATSSPPTGPSDIVPAASLVPVPVDDYPAELDTALAFDAHGEHARKILLKLFPSAAKQIRSYRPVTEEELTQMILGLPQSLSDNLTAALERMNPDMLGMHTARSIEMRLFDMKIYHGTGDDSSRPKTVPVGGLYSTDGIVRATGDKDLAATWKMPETFTGYVIALVESRTLWPPRGDDNDEAANKSRAPLCSSFDRQKGDAYGLCDACSHRPFQGEKERGDCTNEMVVFIVPEDFSGILRWSFAKTGLETGKAIQKATRAGWRSLWEKPFTFTTRKEVSKDDPGRRWYVAVPTPSGTPTPAPIADALRVLARKIDTEVYWPTLRATYLRAADPALRSRGGAPGGESTEPAKKTDGAGLAALAGVAGGASKPLPDLSGGARSKNV